jgi:hypothetical protein
MHINRRFLGWGVFFIVLGAVPLAVRAGALTTDQVAAWWGLWPLIIVGIGVGIVLGRTPFEFLGSIVVAATFGLMAGAFVTVGGQGFPGDVCGSETGQSTFESRSGTFAGPASVDLQLDCGRLDVHGVTAGGWTFDATGDPAGEPSVDADGDSLRVHSREGGFRAGFVGRRDDWQVGVPTGVPLTLNVQLNAGQATIAPGAAQLDDLSVQLNAGSITIDLGEVTTLDSIDVQGNAGSASLTLPNASLDGRLQVNAGSIEFCVPAGAGLRVRTGSNPIASYDLDGEGLLRNGDTWESPGYDSADVRIDLRVEANVGSISLNPEDGCDE